ncbi:MAG: type II toxin-antitoxin system VapC family toxin [Reyranella sp.]|uniref:type II toxin-antitoxin system VapC family toxin n=1 Tax=Reyranella sp. TaxID=1929291 RepID=UPI003D12EC19
MNEPDAGSFADAIVDSEGRTISSFNMFESHVVIHRRSRESGVQVLTSLLSQLRLTTAPFDDAQAALAFEAHCRYGKGNHPAALNIGDCAAYALAKSLDAPLLFKGNDFTRTDIRSVL